MKIPANTRPFSVSRSWFAAAGLLASLSLVPAYGANIDLGTSGDWAVGSNWVGGSVPTSSDMAYIQGGLEATVSGTTTVNGVTVGTGQTAGTLNINSGATFTTTTNHITMGNKGTGTLNVNGGIVTVGTGGTRDIWVGQNNAVTDRSSGTINLYSGSITARTVMLGRSNNASYINSEGYLNIYGGSFTAAALTSGSTANNTYGEILISGSAATIQVGNAGIVLDNSKITYRIDAAGVSTLSSTGNIVLAGDLVIGVVDGVDVLPSSIILLETDSSKTITGTFSGYTSGETYTWGDVQGTYIIDDTLKQVRIDNISLIPEPSSTALMVGGLTALLVFLQRRRRR